ncbi:MAG TPA: serine hydrolase [Rhodothermales bacterium]|nr:serine hydrolase [Rhodothermales bacterium]
MQAENALRNEIDRTADDAGAEAVSVSYYDYETETAWSYRGDRWFHAASTIKLAVLAALYAKICEGVYHPRARLHVRNWFRSVADGKPFRVASSRDANAEVHAAVGKTMRLEELARHMIATSSNLATNLLVDLLTSEGIRETLKRMDVEGVDFHRGVEDERAFEAGINNRVTANGLVHLLRAIYGSELFSEECSRQMVDILLQQEFTSGIPAGLPREVRKQARIANKTGEISTVAHDAGLVFLPDRKPYALAILTQWPPGQSGRQDAVSDISGIIYASLTGQDEAHVQ